MSNKDSLGHHMIDISQKMGACDSSTKTLSAELEDLISRLILPRFCTHKLNSEHILIIAKMFDKTLSDSGRIEPLSLLREIYQEPHIVLEKLDLILQLIESRIIDCDNKKYLKVKRKNDEPALKLDRSVLIDVYVGFSERFMTFMLGADERTFSALPKPFKHNREYVSQWFEYVGALFDARSQHRLHGCTEALELDAVALKEEIDARMARTKKRFQFPKFVQHYNLSADEQVILMYVLKESLENRSPTDDELQVLLNNTLFEKYSKPSILSARGTLIREGLLLRSEQDALLLSYSEYEIAADIASLVLNGKQYSDIAIIQDIIKHDNIFSIQRPSTSLGNLVLPQEKVEVIRQALSKYKSGGVNLLREWGILDSLENDIVLNRGQDPGRLRMLFYGPPGTGKTALANAVANALRRPILCTDASKILDKWVGDSEKNVSKLFSTYRRICKRTKRSPILLLDEADQFISARCGATQSVDRMYNQIQNIFLENLEKFNGILIATTNLLDNIDNAFSRRFDIKMELTSPPMQLRRKLWKRIIPSTLPLSDDINFDELARDFVFTGGQIKVVVHNAAVAAAARSGSRKMVRQEDLLKYAELEQRGSFDNSTPKKPIGFSRNEGHI